MARNGSGTYTLPGSDFVFDTVISETAMNQKLNDIEAELTNSVATDGQTTMSGNLKMGSNKVTGLAAGTTNGDATRYEQVLLVANNLSDLNNAGTALDNIGIDGSSGNIAAGDIASGAVTEAKIGTGAVTVAKIGSGAVSGPKIAMGSDAQGDILYHNGTNYARLGAGTSGHFLKTQGAGANPTWDEAGSGLTSATVQSLSGTSIDFTSIPSGTKRITISIEGMSTNGTSNTIIQIGDSGGIETSGYLGATQNGSGTNHTSGFITNNSVGAASVVHGIVTLTLINSSSNIWAASVLCGLSNGAAARYGGGSKALSAELDRVRLTMANGTDTFDAGSVNILYE